MAEARGRPKLRLDIGADASAEGRVKGRNIDDPHRLRSGPGRVKFK
jgi:hypothetical protein